MRTSQLAFVVVMLVAGMALTVHVLHDKGLPGAIADWTRAKPADGAAPNTGNAPGELPATAGGESGSPSDKTADGPRRTNVVQMRTGGECWDRGDFETAASCFQSARAVAGTDAERADATRCMDRALLAWSCTYSPPRDTLGGPKGEAALAKLISTAESSQSESDWVEALRYAAGARLRDRLPYLATNAIECARPGGPVERFAREMLPKSGSRADLLTEAIARRGLLAGGRPASGGTATAAGDRGDDNPGSVSDPGERSGILGSADRAIPYGQFSQEMKKRLREALDKERLARKEYELAGPDKPDRLKHAREAVGLLKDVQLVYGAALDEDPKSSGMQSRTRDVTRMLSDLRKSLPAGE